MGAYVKYLRPKMGPTTLPNVFLSCSNKHCSPAALNYSSLYKILQKFSTSTGKKLSSRVLRTSKITESRKKNMTHEEKTALAGAMNHTLATAERSYNYRRPSEYVAKVLSRTKSSSFSEESSLIEDNMPLSSSTPLKRCKQLTEKSPLPAASEYICTSYCK